MTDYVIREEQLANIEEDAPKRITETCNQVRSRPVSPELKNALNEFMKAIDWRFNDTEKGRMIIKTIREIKDNLPQNDYPDVDGLQEFPFRSSSKHEKPNCYTCPKSHTKDCPIDYEKTNGNSDIFDGISRVRDNCLMGCHPFVKEWLMKDVIDELEQQAKTCGSTEQQYALRDAIKLNRGKK